MSDCIRREEVAQTIRAGQWPNGCASDLQQHVAACARCTEETNLLTALAAARQATMRTLPAQSPELLWWKAQLRRRHKAMQQMQRPALAISAATITASILVLLAAAALAWKHIARPQLFSFFFPASWNLWLALPLAAFLVVATVLAADSLREHS